MTKIINWSRVLGVSLLVAGLVGLAITSGRAAPSDVEVELDEAEVFIEWNSTDHRFRHPVLLGRRRVEENDGQGNENGKEVLDVRRTGT